MTQKFTQSELTQLDDLAKHAMLALIAKTPPQTLTSSSKPAHNPYTAVALGAYEYALAMMDARDQVLLKLVPEDIDHVLPNPVHDLAEPEPELLFVLHGEPVYKNTRLETRDWSSNEWGEIVDRQFIYPTDVDCAFGNVESVREILKRANYNERFYRVAK